MSGEVFIDTNVLVYAFDASEPARQRKAAALLESVLDSGRGVVSTQVLKELFVVITRKVEQPLSVDDAMAVVDDLCVLRVVDDTLPLLRRALALCAEHGFSLWDATLIAAASAAGCEVFYSEDMAHGQKIAGLEIRNPFL